MAQAQVVERSILKALEKPDTCTSDTLLSIKSILSPITTSKDGAKEKENVRGAVGHARAKSLVSTTKVTAKTAGRTKTHSRQLTVVEVKQDVVLNEQEKVNFAFQVVNGCIKQLSLLAKEHIVEKRVCNEVAAKAAPKMRPADTALRPKSPNARRFKTIDEVCKPTAKTMSPAFTIASCACAALVHLQGYYTVFEGKDKTHQVENGTLAVIAKCIDLELTDLAIAQIKSLKVRLMQHLGLEGERTIIKKENTKSWLDLLDFPEKLGTGIMLQSAVRLQQHVWQLAHLQNGSEVIEVLAASEHVECKLLKVYTKTLGDPSKGQRQLVAMSRLLLQTSSMSGLSPEAICRLRCFGWDLQLDASPDLREDDAKNICARLARCVESMVKNLSAGKAKANISTKTALDQLLERLSKFSDCSSDILRLKKITMRLWVPSKAQDATVTDEMEIDEQSSPAETLRDAAHGLTSDGQEHHIRVAVLATQQSMPPEKADCDRLLVEVVGLRRSLHKVVSEKRLSGDACFAAASACILFLRRYLKPSNVPPTKKNAEVEGRLRVGKKFIKPFISTLIVCGMHHGSPTLDMFTHYQACCDFFLEVIEIDNSLSEDRFGDLSKPETSIFVTISKVCHKIWSARIAEYGPADELGFEALKTAIRVVESWTVEEREATQYLHKLRYLMDSHMAREEWADAVDTFTMLLKECSAAGHFDQISEQAMRKPPHQLRERGSVGALIFRCFQSRVMIMLKLENIDHNAITLSNADLAPAVHGILLEWQLEQLSTYHSQQRTPNKSCTRLIELTQRKLLEVYDKRSFPVRRLRAGACIAHLLADLPKLYEARDLLEDAGLPAKMKNLGVDSDLSDEITYLQADLQSTVALLDPFGDSTPSLLEQSLEVFAEMCCTINNASDVAAHIDDVGKWCDQLESVANFHALRRDVGKEAKTIEVVLRVLMHVPEAYDRYVRLLCRLASAHTVMGRSGHATKALEVAEECIKNCKASAAFEILILLSRAEILIAIADYTKCNEVLEQAAQLATRGAQQSFPEQTFASASPTLNVDDRRLVARAAYLNGMLDIKTGNADSALRFCIIAKCMLFKIWSSLEQVMPRDVPVPDAPAGDGCPSSDDASGMEDVQPTVITRSYSHLSTPQLRMLVPDLMQVAMLELQIHDFRGAYHEAFSALKHANKIANYVGAGAAAISDMAAADLYLRSLPLNSLVVREQKVRDARTRIDLVDEAFLASMMTMDVLAFGAVKADLLIAEEEAEEQLTTLETTLVALKSLLGVAQANEALPLASALPDGIDDLAEKLSAVSINKKSKASKTTRAQNPVPKATKKDSQKKVAKSDSEPLECLPLSAWHARLLRYTSVAALIYRTDPDIAELGALIEKAGGLVPSTANGTDQGMAAARLLLHEAKQQMNADITYNALSDSIVCVPPPQQKDCVEVDGLATKTPRKGKTVNAVRKTTVPEPAFVSHLEKGHDILREVWEISYSSSSVRMLRQHGRLLSGMSTTASACSVSSRTEITHPLVNAFHTDIPAIRSKQTNFHTEHPKIDKIGKDDLRTWPSVISTPPGHLDRSTFQREYIDVIPSAWNVVSMALAEDKSAMTLIRYRSGQSPFIVRIPFAHRESDDPDEEVLDMSEAYARFRSIIKQHEFTAAEAGVTDQSDFKKKWWLKKHELDTELRILLSDVEEQWFSGVKGIFSSQQCDAQALSNLQAQLQSILCQHCPTKKGKGKAKSGLQSLSLELRILELFVGLGDPDQEVEVEGEEGFVVVSLGDSAVMTDGIHELVRLILESLQFAGESIAIDEVDIDNVIVKIIDALRDYHTTINEDATNNEHSVLILDNQLHGFPWESLPCLRNQSVSRLPSLSDLRDRILAARANASDVKPAGKRISRSCGTSLLNPSGDLKKTAQRFQPWLSKLPPNWAHLRKSPDDAGWRDLLSENELFLYVGHGSTSQYVRPRVVKRLGYNERNETTGSTCAVSWLIGCGSVAVEDLGEFEPSGMVLSYLAAGSPAVLGALWDVGDIDADHFSITAGDYWGLWDESNKGLDPKLFPARKKISEEKKALGRGMSMTEAVARSRGGCKLPYLNGAAFVVYGIPVFLD